MLKKKPRPPKALRRKLLHEDDVRRMLAIVLRNGTAMQTAFELLRHEHFADYSLPYGIVWTAAKLHFHDRNTTPTLSLLLSYLQHELTEHGSSEDETVEGLQDFFEWAFDDGNFSGDDVATSIGQAEFGIKLAKQFVEERTVVLASDELLKDGTVPQNAGDSLEKLQRDLQKLDTLDLNKVQTFGQRREAHEAWLQQFRGKKLIGLKTNMPELDRRTRGLRGLFIIGAKPGAGKTALAAVQIAVGVCRCHADNDAVVVVVSLEMGTAELETRTISHLAGLDWSTVVFGSEDALGSTGSDFSQRDKERLEKAESRIVEDQIDRRLVHLDRSILGDEITAGQLASVVKHVKETAGAKRALIVIDYLQQLPVPTDVASGGELAADKYRVRLVQQVLEASRTPEDPLGDTALVISETRKPMRSKDPWGGSLSELMGTARLGYAADAVILYREMSDGEITVYYGSVTKPSIKARRRSLLDNGIAPIMLILEKGRDGMQRGSWGADFHFRTSSFKELEPVKLVPDDDDEPTGANGAEQNAESSLPPLSPANTTKSKTKKKSPK